MTCSYSRAVFLCFLVFALAGLVCLKAVHPDLVLWQGQLPADPSPPASTPLRRIPYNPLLALRSLYLCKASYCVPSTAGGAELLSDAASPIGLLGFELYDVLVNDSFGTLAYVGVDHLHQRITAAFRGSVNIANWLSDLTFWSLHYPCPESNSSSSASHSGDREGGSSSRCSGGLSGECVVEDPIQTETGECRVHKGFYEAYHSLSANLTRGLMELHHANPTYSFLITGHSLGGAMAYLCALDIVTRPEFLARPSAVTAGLEVYTFGEPRSSNEPMNAYAATLLGDYPGGNRRHFRLTHARDPVPHLPPLSWGYIHQPQELWYYRNGTLDDSPFVFAVCEDDPAGEDPMCSNSIWSTTVSDHLWYMGTCTRCLCAQKDLEEMSQYRLSPALAKAIAEDRATRHGKRHR